MSERPNVVHRWSHTYSILSTCAFPGKKLLFAGTQDSKILVFDILTYNLIKVLTLGESKETHTRCSVLCLDKSVDEQYLFSAGGDSLVRVWSIGKILEDSTSSFEVNEVATIYSVTDIGDIFSIKYIDSLETIVLGCKNASLLYLDNIFAGIHGVHTNFELHLDRLPHTRYDKFFDSYGPTGSASPPSRDSQINLNPQNHQNTCGNAILEIPAKNTIKYAHNGFIYSICELGSAFNSIFDPACKHKSENKGNQIKEYIISGGGDGLSKIWCLENADDGSVNILLCSELCNEDSILSQDIEFPFLYCGLSDGVVKIWDLNTKQLVSTLSTPTEADIMSLSVYNGFIFAFNETGITLFNKGKTDHIDPNQGKMLNSGIFERINTSGKVTPNLLTGGNDGSLTLWNLIDTVGAKDDSFSQTATSWTSKGDSHKINTEEMLETLKDLIAFETVSQSIPNTTYQLASRRCATYLQQLFFKFGASESKLLPISENINPVVFAYFKGNADPSIKKRILWYGHYDVIPPGDRERWNTDPFSLTCEDGYMKGRGISDNKGPLVSAIHSVAKLFSQKKLVNDIVFLVEGSEEIGSLGFSEVCQKYQKLIEGDMIHWIFLSNSTWVDRNHPCLNYGLRGVINAKIKISSDFPDSHSGVKGGIFREPTADIINIISKLQDDEGLIKIPNFYSTVKEIEKEEYERFKMVSETANIEKHNSVDELITNWSKPSLSITTLSTSGPGNVTVIPQSTCVGLSIRLVPGQHAETIRNDLISYVQSCFQKLSSSNHLVIDILNEAEAWLGDPHNNAYQIIKSEITNSWGIEPLFVREGGSVPSVGTLERVFKSPAVQIPCGQSTDNGHLDNENLRIKNLSNMAEILSNVFNRL